MVVLPPSATHSSAFPLSFSRAERTIGWVKGYPIIQISHTFSTGSTGNNARMQHYWICCFVLCFAVLLIVAGVMAAVYCVAIVSFFCWSIHIHVLTVEWTAVVLFVPDKRQVRKARIEM